MTSWYKWRVGLSFMWCHLLYVLFLNMSVMWILGWTLPLSVLNPDLQYLGHLKTHFNVPHNHHPCVYIIATHTPTHACPHVPAQTDTLTCVHGTMWCWREVLTCSRLDPSCRWPSVTPSRPPRRALPTQAVLLQHLLPQKHKKKVGADLKSADSWIQGVRSLNTSV